MIITIYYIDKNWNLISRLIEMKIIQDTKSAKYFLKIFNTILQLLNIENKVYSYIFFLYFFLLTYLSLNNYLVLILLLLDSQRIKS